MYKTNDRIFCKCGNGSFYVMKNDKSMSLICTKCQESLGVSIGIDVVVKIKE